MDTNLLLYIALVIYVIIIGFGLFFNIKWLIVLAGLLWFIPIIEIDNMFIILLSVIMLLGHGVLLFSNKESGDF